MTARESTLSLARLVAILLPNALLWGAIGSQYLGGLVPCEMCMWQRWPHIGAILAALLAIVMRGKAPVSATFTALAALALATSGAIGVYHAGVEYDFWEGFTSCTALLPPGGFSLDAIMAAPMIRCDQPQWTWLGISLAGYNALISLGGAALILLLVRQWSRA
jgi:disulfide bond formation protein DsbB